MNKSNQIKFLVSLKNNILNACDVFYGLMFPFNEIDLWSEYDTNNFNIDLRATNFNHIDEDIDNNFYHKMLMHFFDYFIFEDDPLDNHNEFFYYSNLDNLDDEIKMITDLI